MKTSKVELYMNGVLKSSHPIYSDNLVIDKERESGEMYHRTRLNSSFTFVREDYDILYDSAMDSAFEVKVYDSRSNVLLARGTFEKTDCTFDTDNRICNVKVTSADDYDAILKGKDDEYDLISLAPVRESLTLNKRAILQLYLLHDNKVTNVIGNMSYEVDVNSGIDIDSLNELLLESRYNFAPLVVHNYTIVVSKMPTGYTQLEGTYSGTFSDESSVFSQVGGTNKLVIGHRDVSDPEMGDGTFYFWQFKDANNNIITITKGGRTEPITTRPLWQNLPNPVGSSMRAWGFNFGYNIYREDIEELEWQRDSEMSSAVDSKTILGRVLMDATPSFGTGEVRPVPEEDLCATNLNYHYTMSANYFRVSGRGLSDFVKYSDVVQDEPTEWGVNGVGKYFVKPTPTHTSDNIIPIGWSRWIPNSIWFESTPELALMMDLYSVRWELKDAYPLWSAIKVLMAKIDPTISFDGTATYSQFLYGNIAVGEIAHWVKNLLYITPSTNVKRTYYSQAARKGKITLGQILDMLRATCQLYWFIDSQKRLRIEHISWFKNGGNYSQVSPLVDLTEIRSPKLGKEWTFGENTFEYDKSAIVKRYEFGWNGDVSKVFDGMSIDIKNRFARNGSTLKSVATNFVSDVDLIVSSPDVVSDDCFVVIGVDDTKYCPIVRVQNFGMPFVAPYYYMQNAYMSYYFLEMAYWTYDLTGGVAEIADYKDSQGNNGRLTVEDTMRLRKQNVNFPIPASDVGKEGIIRTALGDGEIVKATYNAEDGMVNGTLVLPTKLPLALRHDDFVAKSGGVMTYSYAKAGNVHRFVFRGNAGSPADWAYVKVYVNNPVKVQLIADCEAFDFGYIATEPLTDATHIEGHALLDVSGTQNLTYNNTDHMEFYLGYTKDGSGATGTDSIEIRITEL